MALDAIKRAGSSDPQAICDALAQTKDFDGVTGKITMNADGDVEKSEATLKVVKDGKFTYLKTLELGQSSKINLL